MSAGHHSGLPQPAGSPGIFRRFCVEGTRQLGKREVKIYNDEGTGINTNPVSMVALRQH